MWFIGLIVGAMIGVMLPGSGMVLAGAGIGAAIGAILGSRGNARRNETLRLEQLSARIGELSSRLTIVETRLGVGSPSETAAEPAPSTSAPVAAASSSSAVVTQEPFPDIPEVLTASGAQTGQLAPAQAELSPPIRTAAVAPMPADATPEPQPQAGGVKLDDGQHAIADELTRVWQWLIGGNILAKVGVALLFFGVASGLRLAAQYGLLPVPLRLAATAAAAVAMIWFGRDRFRRGTHLMFGFALQGGGFALLYLVVYFMLARYQMVGAAPAFLAFAVIGAVCVLFAARQDAQSLAALGISGAFLAPILASTGSGNHVVLFSYYLLLNVFVVSVNWFKGWRYLNLAAVVFTFLVGIAWGMRSYQPEHFAVIEGFLIAFFLMFSALLVLMILFNAPGKHGCADGLIYFGTPIAAAGIQQALVETRSGLAWSAALAGAYYLTLWLLLFRRRDPATEIAERAQLGIGAVFLTIAIPLAFGAQLTTALWALEGAVLLWYGLRLRRDLASSAGLILQIGAGFYFAWHLGEITHVQPLLNNLVTGSVLIAAAALYSARLLERAGDKPEWAAAVSWMVLVWALAWIAFAAGSDIDTFVARADQPAVALVVAAALAVAFNLTGRALDSRLLRLPAWLSTLALPAAIAAQYTLHPHLLRGWFALVLPAAFASHYWTMYGFDRDGLDIGKRQRHILSFWVLGIAAGIDLAWWTGEFTTAAADFWQSAVWIATGALMVAIALKGIEARRWPFSADPGAFFYIACGPLLVLLALAIVASGRYAVSWNLPYVPPLNPLEVACIAAIAAIIWWGNTAALQEKLRDLALLAVRAGYALGFLLLNFVLARVAHHWFGVAYRHESLYASAVFHGLLSFVWSCLAIGMMIHASRNLLRPIWFVGFGLLAVVGAKLLLVDAANAGTAIWTGTLIGVALLVIAASYYAPRPPAAE